MQELLQPPRPIKVDEDLLAELADQFGLEGQALVTRLRLQRGARRENVLRAFAEALAGRTEVPAGQLLQGAGEILDALRFIPKTSKNEQYRKSVQELQSLDNLDPDGEYTVELRDPETNEVLASATFTVE